MKHLYLILLTILTLPGFSQVFVNGNASGANNGTSWINAYKDLNKALKDAPLHSEIWVAAGTYKPGNGVSRDSSFTLKAGMQVFGGFAGTEVSREQRNHTLNRTILSGQIGASDTTGNIHVLLSLNHVADTVLVDGFVFTKSTNNKPRTNTITLNNSRLKISNCDIVDNVASISNTGAGGIKADSSFVQIENCNFTNNMAGGGRSLYLYQSKVSASGCTFSGNKNFNGYANYLVYYHNTEESIKFENCVFSQNDQGTVYCYGKETLFQSCSFLDNTADSYLIYAGGDSIVTKNCVFERNEADNLVYYGNGRFRNTKFSDNKAAAFYSFRDSTSAVSCQFYNNHPVSYSSGFIYTRFLDLTDCEFVNNNSGGSSYTIYAYDTCNLKNSRFEKNGIYGKTGSAGVLYYGKLYADSCVFNENAANYGGALYGGDALIRNSSFSGNKAMVSAGAIYSYDFVTLENCLFLNNSVDTSTSEGGNGGGAIMAYNGIHAVNTVFANNAAETGAAYFNPFSNSSSFLNCTFYNNNNLGNTASGVIHIPGKFRIRNSILWDKNSSITFPDSADVQFSIVKGGKEGTGNSSLDPQLDLSFSLKETSPAIDGGTPPGLVDWYVPLKDVNGNIRVVNDRLDMGATEYQEVVARNIVKGKVYGEFDDNCSHSGGDVPLPGITLVAEPGPYYAASDSTGSFTFLLPAGEYELRTITPEDNQILDNCQIVKSVSLTSSSDTLIDRNFFLYLVPEPDVRIKVTQSAKRPCMVGSTTVSYWNEGNMAANDVHISIKMAEALNVKSISNPFVRENSLYAINLGSLVPGQKGSIIIQDSTSCIVPDLLGETACVEASVSTLSMRNDNMNMPNLVVASICSGDSVLLTIENTGSTSMTDYAQYRLYFNDTLVKVDSVSLASLAKFSMKIPTLNKVVRLEADQASGFTQKSNPATVNACNIPDGIETAQFFVSTDLDDAPNFRDISCRVITGAYDPNEKNVEPVGKYQEHYIKNTQELEYTIQFQNTGNDTAFVVVLKDTLSVLLDISTLKVLSASHPFTWSLSGYVNPVLTVTFQNILLPDSNTNEPKSHGYANFSIKPKADLEDGHLLTNRAFIYFDYNPPIETNTVYHTIGDLIHTNFELGDLLSPGIVLDKVDPIVSKTSLLYPNPAHIRDQITVSAGKPGVTKQVWVYNAQGVTLSSLTSDRTQLLITTPVEEGVYFYKIQYSDGETICGTFLIKK